jgi:hypothetical protein
MDHLTTQAHEQSSVTPAYPYAALMAWANFHKIVFYGTARWPSYSYWIVPGTITDETRM